MTRRRFVILIVAIFGVGVALRTLWLRSDPPVSAPVGVVWHDEGAWVHNARNRALWGTWRTDAWNPVFVAPVFTALEYESFRLFGVGTWQARLVPVASGLFALAALTAGLLAARGRRAALTGALLLATNYVFVMWNRAALMESTMTAFIVISWAAYALAERRPLWGLVAGAAAALAWFTKAAAAFFLAAVILECALAWIGARGVPAGTSRRAASYTLAGLAIAGLAIALAFVLPNWTEYRFYNWQMSVTRKPDYAIRAFLDRASWLPVVSDLFTRLWLVLAAATVAIVGIVLSWRESRPAERLLVLWVLIGLAELVVHDSGNERRYVMFIPALIALAVMGVDPGETAGLKAGRSIGIGRSIRTALLLLPLGYLLAGSLLRPVFLADAEAGHYSTIVRLSAGIAVALAALALWQWERAVALADRLRHAPAALAIVVLITSGWDLLAFGAWANTRGTKNYEASVAVGRLLPAGTLVHGKLANGLALENRIRPVFVGNGFGNYEDRLRRDDVRYILTYDLPRLGYESSDGSGLIEGMLDRYPRRKIVSTFDVDETPETDRAALIDKEPDAAPLDARH